MKRKFKVITDKKDLEEIFSLKEEDITLTLICEYFGEFNGKSRFQPYDVIEVPPNTYHKNKNKFTTTIGIWIFNIFFIDNDYFDIFGYINKTFTADAYSDFMSEITFRYLEDQIDRETYITTTNKIQKCMPYVDILSPHMTDDFFKAVEKIKIRKEQLLKQHAKELDKEGNNLVVDNIEKELLAYAKELLKDDPSFDTYLSGARSSLKNDFKNMYIMRGASKDPDPTKGYNVMTGSFIDGIKEDEYTYLAKTLTGGPYARGNKTRIGGYWEKLFLAAFQHIILDPKDSDCKTNRTLTRTITKQNKMLYMYSYMVEPSGKLTELTYDVMNKLIGKTIKIRFSSLCASKTGICNKCAGNLFYRIGIENIGTVTPIIPTKIKLISMKAFHDSTLKYTEIDPMKTFLG